METVLFVLLVIVLVLLINLKNSMSHRLNEIHERMHALSQKLNKISDQEKQVFSKGTLHQPENLQPIVSKTKPIETPELIRSAIPPINLTPEPVKEILSKETSSENPVERKPAGITEPKLKAPLVPKRPGFFERNPDLEKFIGENLANKIGIGILVLGIGFFVKYAIDKEWINVYGRVFIGILCGGVLIGLAHYLRKTFAAFSSVLVGGGIAILYLTITIAFHEYQIIGQTSAFLIMVVITAFTIILSVAYNRIELAILAILGGFGSPFMVSTGEGNYVVLFTYILILDTGMLVLAYFKKWNAVTIIGYAFTIILFGSWLSFKFDAEQPGMMVGAMIFALLFYLIFFATNIINNLKERTRFKTIEVSLLLSNTFLFYSAGMYILSNPDGDVYRGLFTAFLGVFNFIFAFVLFKNTKADRNLVFVLIGLVLTFISLAVPVQLEGNHITLFWAAETALLLWLSQKSGIRLMKVASVIIMGLMWISLAMDWRDIYGGLTTIQLSVIFNKGYVTGAVALISIAITLFLLKNEKDEGQLHLRSLKWVLTIVGILFLYLGNFLELNHQLNYFVADPAAQAVIIGAYNMLFILGLVYAERKLNLPEKAKVLYPGWGILAIVTYFLFYHSEIISTRDNYISGESSFLGFGFHYLLVFFLLIVSAWSVNRFRQLKEFNEYSYNLYSWFFVFFFLFIASAELDHTVVLTMTQGLDSIPHIVKQNHKIGFPILWGLASFILIAVGLKKKRRHLRIISLTVFLITLLKLFLVDIRGISEGGKIAAFISLGIMLLIVSFMYQRLKKFLLEDEIVTPEELKQNENSPA